MPDLYYLEKNVISKEEIEGLKSFIDSNLEPDYRPGYEHAGMTVQDVYRSETKVYEALRKAVRVCNKTFTENYSFAYNRFELKRLFGNVMHPGAFNEPHDDDGDVYPGKPEIEEHYSAVLMLSDEYEGGELYFVHHGVTLKLEAGDLIMFRGNAENLHGVKDVISGKRMNVIIFFRNYPLDDIIIGDEWEEFINS